MKRSYFSILLAVLMLAGSVNVFAQKKNVSKAKAKILSEVPDTKAAREAILPALEDPTTKNLANTWFIAGEVFHATYEEQQKLEWTQKKGDKALMGESVKQALTYYIKADSLDRAPDAKGKVKPKLTKKITDKVVSFQNAFTQAGSHFYSNKEFDKAFVMFDTYLSYPEISFLKGMGLEKDTLRTLITYYCGLCATQANKPEVAIKYYELVKDSIDSEWIYARLSEDYAEMKDTVNMLRMYQLGSQKFPKEPFYTRNLINYYINKNLMDEAMTWIEKAISQDEKSGALWNVKGRILENDKKMDEAIASYEKAIELDPEMADPLGNIGRIIYNSAVEELERVNAIKDDRLYLKEKAKLKDIFSKALPYFEKAYELNPKERDYVIALRGIYYNLGQDAKYKEMEERMKNF
ncbi:MAG: tetratricopeptide repeat protein [Bacteroidales bacterium]|jgi:tetratricopeptide (TPR) repeat protein|nr:tetratricopeptide repeat protein [Bacteroidales bacterium]